MIILAIESSCDETAIAILQHQQIPPQKITSSSSEIKKSQNNNCNLYYQSQGNVTKILANVINSQIKIHQQFGGVVPEVAARNHLANINKLIVEAVAVAKINLEDVDYFVATSGPGLIGGLIVGMMSAKTLSAIYNKKFIAVNHLVGHALTTRLTADSRFPFLLLLLSGGHCQIILVKNAISYQVIGETIDDALGECFDKVAQMLGLEYPGGPKIEEIAKNGNPQAIKFPKPLLDNKEHLYNFSFSGLKTAVMRYIENKTNEKFNHQSFKKLSNIDIADISASFQRTIAEILINRLENTIKNFTISNLLQQKMLTEIVISGGVAANRYILNAIQNFINNKFDYFDIKVTTPPLSLCTDNAVMIGWAAIEEIKHYQQEDKISKIGDKLDFAPRSNWQLNNLGKIDN